MGRLILLLLLALALGLTFDESRAVILDRAEPLLAPVFRWQTGHEMEEIARGLQTVERENHGRLPDERDWRGWLERNYHGEAALDSWGSPYYYQVRSDSFFIVSPGPDRVYRTQDDLFRSKPRSDTGR